LPDGTTVAADDLNQLPSLDKPAQDFRVTYLVNDPAPGTYLLILRDTSGAKPTASIEFKVG
jgi:hypothetical protein